MVDYDDELDSELDSELDDDFDHDEEIDLIPCPNCGVEIYDEAVSCPACGEYVIHSTNAFRGKPALWILIGLAGVAAVLFAILAGQFIGP